MSDKQFLHIIGKVADHLSDGQAIALTIILLTAAIVLSA